MTELVRCSWAEKPEIMTSYHDEEWGVPQHNDHRLFEMLILEGAQAGLSWSTVLSRRETFRKAFDNFDPMKVADYDESKIAQLIIDPGIIRHEGKIRSAVSNARAFLGIQHEFGSFDHYIWDFVDGVTIKNRPANLSDLPVTSPIAAKISKALMQRGFRFVGPTICYAYMQAIGIIDDHMVTCFRSAD